MKSLCGGDRKSKYFRSSSWKRAGLAGFGLFFIKGMLRLAVPWILYLFG